MRIDLDAIEKRCNDDRGRVWSEEEALQCYYDRNALIAELRLAREVVEAAKAYVRYHTIPTYEPHDPDVGATVWVNLVWALDNLPPAALSPEGGKDE